MIVVDTNVVAYLLIPGDRTDQAVAALRKDSSWLAPVLWRSEFRSVLTFYLRQGQITLSQALRFMQEAERLMRGGEYEVPSQQVLSLVASSTCSAYDCEFVALAQEMGVPMVTTDALILADFHPTAVSLEDYVA